MKSIRVFLIIVLLSTICLVNFFAALNGYTSSIEAGDSILDERLATMSKSLARMSTGQTQIPANAFSDSSIFQIWSNNQRLNGSDNAPVELLAPLQSGFHILNLNGVQWRITVYLDSRTDIWVIYGERYDQFRKLIDTMISKSVLPIIWVLPIIGLLIWLIVGYSLKPLHSFAETLKRRGANELKPIDDDRLPKELITVVESTNKLFNRLSDAFDRERRFAADAAHELRTPLAALKVNLHNHAQEHKLSDESFLALQTSAKRMENSIEQILALYKLTPENFQHTIVPTKLKSLAQQSIISLYNLFDHKNQKIELVGDDIQIDADQFALSVLFKNLLENASKYSPTDSQILLTISTQSSETAKIIIEDSGKGIIENDYEKVFDRFYRVGHDRHESGVVGTGLGLSIVKHVVELHRGSIQLSKSNTLGGLAVTILLPIQQQSLEQTS